MSAGVGPTATAVAHLGSLGRAKGFGTFWGWGPWCPRPLAKASWCGKLAHWGRVEKNDFSPAEVGVGWGPCACPAHHVLRASGPRGTGSQAVRGGQEVPRGSPAGRGRNVLKQQQPKDRSLNSRFRTAHRRCRPQTPIPSSPGTQGSSSHPGLRSHNRRVRVQGLLLLGIRGWVFP